MAALAEGKKPRPKSCALTKADADVVKSFSGTNYKAQACRFLDLFWNPVTDNVCFGDAVAEREEVWKAYQLFIKLDPKKEAGNELDEFNSHRALERTEGALTVQEMRVVFAEADVDHNHCLSLMEYLLFKYHIDWQFATTAISSDGDSKVREASTKVSFAQEQLQLAIAAEEAAHVAKEKAVQDEADSITKEAAAAAAEEEVRSAQEAQAVLVASLKTQESKWTEALAALEAKGEDESLGVVTRNKAKAELAQMKSRPSLEINRAKIGLDAGMRRVTKALKTASADKIAAAAAHREAVASVAAAEEAEHASEASRLEAELAFRAAQDLLEFCKANATGCDEGTIWWIGRELEEAMKYMPKSKAAKIKSNPSSPIKMGP